MEQTTDAEKAMAVFEFLDFKRKKLDSSICGQTDWKAHGNQGGSKIMMAIRSDWS